MLIAQREGRRQQRHSAGWNPPQLTMPFFLVLLGACLVPAAAYPSGQVTVSCKDMLPRHGSHAPNPAPSPYELTAEKTIFHPGDQIKVTLSAPAPVAKPFNGFLIEARDAANLNGDVVGTFTLVNSATSQLLNCGPLQGSAVSHTSADKQTDVQVIWNAPKDAPRSVQFLATVVEHYSVYWAKIPGPVVSQSGGSPPPTLPSTTLAETTTPSELSAPFSSEGCGTSMSCFRDPEGCDPGSDAQCFFLSFANVGHAVQFQLSGPAEGYVSFALSFDKWMGNDDVYLCVQNGDIVDIDAAYAEGRTHPELAPKGVLTDAAWRLSDGNVQCRFRRDIHVPSDERRFDLNESFYIFLAHGAAESGAIRRHHRQPLISTKEKVICGTPENLAGSRSPLIIKFHGALMLSVWLTVVSTAVIVARYFKLDWASKTLFGQKVWFQVHRGLMTVAVLLTCAAFTLPFIYRGGWSKRAKAHAYLGCVVMVLAILQPLGAAFRPHPDSTRAVSVAAVVLGIQQQALLLASLACVGVIAGVLSWGLVAVLLLELHRRGLAKLGLLSCLFSLFHFSPLKICLAHLQPPTFHKCGTKHK
ncbi:putative ferric-chelate reductase 1 [Arapaima gigas]